MVPQSTARSSTLRWSTARLQVNIDHVATVRQARRTVEPDPVHAAALAELGGADGITVHLREDRRHIQDRDVELLRQTVRTRLNLEMACTAEMIDVACRVRPDEVTLVPERREELTTEGGLDVVGHEAHVRDTVARLREGGLHVSLFIDPAAAQVEASARVGADAVELHTGRYAEACLARRNADRETLQALATAARAARGAGLVVHAGHGLDYWNTAPVASIEGIEELNIGHAIVSRAVLVGMRDAVSEMARILREAAWRRDP